MADINMVHNESTTSIRFNPDKVRMSTHIEFVADNAPAASMTTPFEVDLICSVPKAI